MQRTIGVTLYTLFEVRRHKIFKILNLKFFVSTFIYFRSKDSQVQSSISIVLLPESSQMKFFVLFVLHFMVSFAFDFTRMFNVEGNIPFNSGSLQRLDDIFPTLLTRQWGLCFTSVVFLLQLHL